MRKGADDGGEHQGVARPTAQDRRALVAVGLGMAFSGGYFATPTLRTCCPRTLSALVPFDAASTVSPVTLFYAVTLVFGLLLLIAGAAVRVRRGRRSWWALVCSRRCCRARWWFSRARMRPSRRFISVSTAWRWWCCRSLSCCKALPGVRVCRLVARQDPKRSCTSVPFLAGELRRVAGVFLQIPRFEALVVISPACSALCLLFAPRVREAGPEAALSVPGAPANEQGSVAAQVPRSVVAVLVLLLALIVCIKGVSDLLYVGSDGSTLYASSTSSRLPSWRSSCRCACSPRVSRFAFLGWAVLVGGVVSGLVILFLFPDSPSAFQFGLGTIAAAKTCLELFMFIVVACTRRDDAGGYPAVARGARNGFLPGGVRCAARGVSRGERFCRNWIGVLPLAAGAAIAVSTFTIMSSLALKGLNEGVRDEVTEGAEGEADETDDELRFDEIAARFDLTKRERETAYLFSRATAPSASPSFHYVSLNTT